MDKEFMLTQLKLAIDRLTKQYRKSFTVDGTSSTYNSATVKRSKTKKELYLAKLIYHLLILCPNDIRIDDDDECDAFDRLTEPRSKK